VARALRVEILGDASKYSRALGDATQSTNTFGSGLKRVATAALAAGAAYVSLDAVKNVVKSAIAAQEANDKLTVAFKNQKIAMDATSPAVLKLEASSRKLGFANDDTRASLTKLITAGQSYGEAAREMGVAQDLARVKGIGLGDAVTALIRLQTGSTRAAKEFGLALPPVTAAVDKLKASHVDLTSEEGKHELALARVQDKLATGGAYYDALTAKVQGQGAAFAGTAAGGMAQFHAQLSNLGERIGTALLPKLQALLDWTNAHWPEIVAVVSGAASAIGTVFTTLGSAIQPVIDFFRQHETAAKALGIALAGTAVAIKVFGAAMAIGKAVTEAYVAVMAAGQIAVAAFTAAEGEAKVAQLGLNVAMKANPLGLVLTGVAAVAAAVLVFSSRLSSNVAAFSAASTSARGYKDALDGLKTSTSSLTAAHLGVEQAELTLARARQTLSAITKTNSTTSLAYREASLGVKQALFGVQEAQDAERKAKEESRTATTQMTATTEALRQKLTDAQHTMEKLKGVFGETAAQKLYQAALKEISTAAGGTSTALGRAIAQAASFKAAIDALPTYHKTVIVTEYQTTGSPPSGRQHGGPVSGGRPYIVGEHGPEVFVPWMSGKVLPSISAAFKNATSRVSSGVAPGGFPLGRGTASGGSAMLANRGLTIENLNINVHAETDNPQRLAQALAEPIRRELLRTAGRNVSAGFG
jgi:hypothetical protein